MTGDWGREYSAPETEEAAGARHAANMRSCRPLRIAIERLVAKTQPKQVACLGAGLLHGIPYRALVRGGTSIHLVNQVSGDTERGIARSVIATGEDGRPECIYCTLNESDARIYCRRFRVTAPYASAICDRFEQSAGEPVRCEAFKRGGWAFLHQGDGTSGYATAFAGQVSEALDGAPTWGAAFRRALGGAVVRAATQIGLRRPMQKPGLGKRLSIMLIAGDLSGAIAAPVAAPAAAEVPVEIAYGRAHLEPAWRARIQSFLDRGTVPLVDLESSLKRKDGEAHLAKALAVMDELGLAPIAFDGKQAKRSGGKTWGGGPETTAAGTGTPKPGGKAAAPPRQPRYKGIISDGYANFKGRKADPDGTIQDMDRNNIDVVLLWVKRQGGWTDDDTLALSGKYPGRVIPGIAFQNKGWTGQKKGFIEKVRRKAATGMFRALGEVSVRGKIGGNLNAPPDSPLLKEVLDISAENSPGGLSSSSILRRRPGTLPLSTSGCARSGLPSAD